MRGSTSSCGRGQWPGTAPSRCQQHRAGGCWGAVPACLGSGELIPCGMPWPGERGRPRRLGAGSVGFQGSCRAGAATGTDGGRAGPGRTLGFWPCLAALPWPRVLLSLWPAGLDESCPGLHPGLRARRHGVAGGTHHPPAPLPTRPKLQEVFPSARRCQPALETFARLAALRAAPSSVTAALPGGHPSELGYTRCHRGYRPQSWSLRGCRAPLPAGAYLGNRGGGPSWLQPQHLSGRASGSQPPRGVQRWGCGICRIEARGWAGFLRQKIPGRLPGSAGGQGLAVSPVDPRVGEPCWRERWPAGGLQQDPQPLRGQAGAAVGAGGPWDLECTHAHSAGGAGSAFPGSLGLPLGSAGSGAGWRSGASPCLQSPHFAPRRRLWRALQTRPSPVRDITPWQEPLTEASGCRSLVSPPCRAARAGVMNWSWSWVPVAPGQVGHRSWAGSTALPAAWGSGLWSWARTPEVHLQRAG